jgi:hypothetical protein
MSEAENPPIAEAPVELPGPSDIPHVSSSGVYEPPGPLQLAFWRFLAEPGRTLRSVLSRNGTAPTKTDF